MWSLSCIGGDTGFRPKEKDISTSITHEMTLSMIAVKHSPNGQTWVPSSTYSLGEEHLCNVWMKKRQEGSDRPWWNDDCTRIGCARYQQTKLDLLLKLSASLKVDNTRLWTLLRGSLGKCLGFFTQRLQWWSIPAWHQNMWHTEPPHNEDKIMKTADVFFRPRWKWHSLKKRQVINRYDH